ncbi:hypothetical protein FSP39_006436 [Pinctada imbricata]|uniref:Dehydrogenase/reductase SDR family member 1 n=1 Tax=Pinctada imbricata TaxID=66713 RepID=A0AA88XQL3_PINIB|nr:hypothetical protein FSP39_006436 [Pinctada imbricata]
MSLKGVVCLVTGATRGIGKGIALQLGQEGATVYITGRTLEARDGDPVGGSLKETAAEIESRGGKCIPVQCNHAKDEDVDKVFEKIKSEQSGRIDILVNNAYAAVSAISDNMGKPFWEQPIDVWDTVNNVGLRNHYRCSVHAAQMMVPRKHGLIVNISSFGGLRYLFNVAYGIGKEGCDRMAADCAFELRKHNVAFVSLWPGPVQTEKIMYLLNNDSFDAHVPGNARSAKDIFANGETTEYAGKAIANLYQDPKLMNKSGRILLTADLGSEYGFTDVNGMQFILF